MNNKNIKVGNVNVSYLDEGSLNKEILLMIHGFSFKTGFIPIIQKLKNKVRIIAPDLPGFGTTQVNIFDYSLENYTLFIKRFLDTLKINKVSLFGNSMGATMSLMFAYKYPEYVEKLIIRSPYYSYKQLPWFLKNKFLLNSYKYLSKNKFFLHLFGNIFFNEYDKLSSQKNYNPKILEEILNQQKNNMSMEAARKILLELGKTDLTSFLSKIDKDVFVFWGYQDNMLKIQGVEKLGELLKKEFIRIDEGAVHNITTVDVNQLTSEIESILFPKK